MTEIGRQDVTPRMSKIVTYGDMIFLSGQTADLRDPDVGRQTEEVLAKIEALLAKAGSDKDHILSATVWLADIGRFDEMNAVWDRWVSRTGPPARATVEAKLARPHILVEIGIVAARKG